MFWALDSTRNGLDVLSYTEIEAYCRLMRHEVEPFEIKAIKAMDIMRVNKTAEVQGKDGQ